MHVYIHITCTSILHGVREENHKKPLGQNGLARKPWLPWPRPSCLGGSRNLRDATESTALRLFLNNRNAGAKETGAVHEAASKM